MRLRSGVEQPQLGHGGESSDRHLQVQQGGVGLGFAGRATNMIRMWVRMLRGVGVDYWVAVWWAYAGVEEWAVAVGVDGQGIDAGEDPEA